MGRITAEIKVTLVIEADMEGHDVLHRDEIENEMRDTVEASLPSNEELVGCTIDSFSYENTPVEEVKE